MTTFAQHRATVESFVDCMHGGADKDALARILAENVVLIGPLSDEPLTGREAVAEAIFWRPLPSAVEMQGHLALDRDLDAPGDGDCESAA
jgi:hypothetical protein